MRRPAQVGLIDLLSQRLRAEGTVRLSLDIAQLAYMIIGGLVLLVIGIAVAVASRTAGPIAVGAVLAALGVALLAYTATDLVQGKLTITVTDEAVLVGRRRFAWTEVVAVRTSRPSRSAPVTLYLVPEAAARLPWYSRRGTRVYLPSVSAPGPALAEWLESVHDAATTDPPPPTG